MNSPERLSIVQPLIVCPKCKLEMRLFGIEADNEVRDLFTFECSSCDAFEVRGVLVGTCRYDMR